MGEMEFTLSRSAWVLLLICLVVLPVGYWWLCKCMAAVSNAPTIEFFMIFGSVGGYILLAVLVRHIGCFGYFVALPFIVCAYGCLIFSMVTALREFPRSRWHVAVAIISGVLMLIPIAMVLWTIKAGGFSFVLSCLVSLRSPRSPPFFSMLQLSPFVLPSGYSRIRLVGSFEELMATRFEHGVNALCWPRELPGDFAEVVRALGTREGMATLDEDHLRSLPLSDAGRVAVEILLEDQRLLREQGLAPILDCISGYPREEEPGVVRTDVYSFHADSATTEADTWLCTYHGPSSEGLRQEDAVRKVDVPEIRAALLEEFGGEDGAEFEEYLQECCYDLHYAPVPGAVPFVFGLGNLWRIAVQHPDSLVPPCVHRAPENVPGELPRLLLIS